MTTGEESKWFYHDYKNDVLAVVLIAPGLNLLPSKMDQLSEFFFQNNCDVFRISLGSNTSQWVDIFKKSYDECLIHSKRINRPLYFLGYSLGGLLGVHYITKHDDHSFLKCALLAPATHTRIYAKIPGLLAGIFKNGSLPSFNLIDYRERSKTTFAEYQKLNILQNEINCSHSNNHLLIPTLLVLNPYDELVSSQKLSKFAASTPHWKTLKLTNKGSSLSWKYHHLLIDAQTLGQAEWEKLLKNLSEHFGI